MRPKPWRVTDVSKRRASSPRHGTRAPGGEFVHDSDNIVKASDVYDHIGLRTNASSLTDSKFVKKLVRAIDSESEPGIWLVKNNLNNKGE